MNWKMKGITILILLVSFSLFTATALAIIGPNLVQNSDFELDDNEDGVPDGWGLSITGGSSISLNRQYKTSGFNSVLIQKANDGVSNWVALWQNIEVQGGATYQINIKVKLGRLEGTADYFWVGGYAYREMPFNTPNFISSARVITPVQSDDFISYTETFVMPEGTKYFQFRIEAYTASASTVYAAKAWVDDFEMAKVDELPPVPPQGVVAKRLANGQIGLNWQLKPAADGDLPTRIESYRSLEADFQLDENTLAADDIQGLSWIDESISSADKRRYYYRLKAFDELGNHCISELIIAPGVANLTGSIITSDGNSPHGTELALQSAKGSFTVTLEADGSFSFPQLEEGAYTLAFRKSGYRLLIREINLQPGIDQNLADLQLVLDQEPPNPPSNIKVEIPTPGLVKLSWDPPVPSTKDGDIAEYYQIYRTEGAIPDFQSAQLLVPRIESISYVDITVQGGKTYIYFVVSFDLADNPSEYAVSAPVTPTIPPRPGLISPAGGEVLIDLRPNLKWESLSDVVNYTVELSTDASFNKGRILKLENLEGNAYLLGAALSEATWYWRVRAHFNTGVSGGFSEAESFVVVNRNPLLGGAGMIKVEPQVFAPRNGEQTVVSYVLDTQSEVSVKIFSTGGQCIKTIMDSIPQNNDIHEFSWDGKDQDGKFVNNGLYFFELITKAPGIKPVRAVGRVLVFN